MYFVQPHVSIMVIFWHFFVFHSLLFHLSESLLLTLTNLLRSHQHFFQSIRIRAIFRVLERKRKATFQYLHAKRVASISRSGKQLGSEKVEKIIDRILILPKTNQI